MFWHIFKYSLKCLFKEKSGFFWTLIFPILLGTLFNMTLTHFLDDEAFEDVNVAIVNSQNADENFISTMEDTDLFVIQETDLEEAKSLLDKGKISGYITCGDKLTLNVSQSGINESIIKSFLDNYSQLTSTVTNVFKINPQGVTEEFTEKLSSSTNYIQEIQVNKNNNISVIYFYTLLAMSCLLSATYGCNIVTTIQANQSNLATRLNVTPTHKLKIFITTLAATFVEQFISLLIILAYIMLILKIDFGNSLGYVLLLLAVGCITGLTLGTTISSITKKSENFKIGLVISITMLGCFLSGMMSTDIKYIVTNKFPAIAYINPANLITDGFYCLYYYNTYDKYFLNIGILSGMIVLFSAITYFVLRRQKYASL